MSKHDDQIKDTPLDQLLERAGIKNGDDTATPSGKKAAAAAAGADEAADAEEERTRREDARFYNEREERARKAFKQLTDIDNEGNAGSMIRSILGGDMLTRIRRQLFYLVMLTVMAIIYVSNRYAYQRAEIRREELNRDLADRKFKALTAASELTEYSMRSNIEENLPDSTLQTSTTSSYYLPVDADNE